MKNDEYRDVPLTLGVALALWAAAVASGTQAGVFVRLQVEAYGALVAFAVAFACAVVVLDARVRGWVAAHGPLVGRVFLAALSVLLVTAGIGIANAGDTSLAQAPWAPVLLFGLPVTASLAIAWVHAALQACAPGARGAAGLAGD